MYEDFSFSLTLANFVRCYDQVLVIEEKKEDGTWTRETPKR